MPVMSKKKATLQTLFNASRFYCKLNIMAKLSTCWKGPVTWLSGIFKVEWQLNKLFRDLGTRSILNPGVEWVRKKQHFRPHSIFSGFIACWIWLKCRLSEKGEILGILKVEWL